MHAWIVERLAPEGEVRFADMPIPMPQAGQCVIRVEAAGMNFLDTLMIRGTFRLAEADKALAAMAGRHTVGKVVILP